MLLSFLDYPTRRTQVRCDENECAVLENIYLYRLKGKCREGIKLNQIVHRRIMAGCDFSQRSETITELDKRLVCVWGATQVVFGRKHNEIKLH